MMSRSSQGRGHRLQRWGAGTYELWGVGVQRVLTGGWHKGRCRNRLVVCAGGLHGGRHAAKGDGLLPKHWGHILGIASLHTGGPHGIHHLC